ncbi:C-C chemokine receptor type 3-like isoform X2 [Salarias fasciatus]|nr:C-C chemokine receptor type 3-like isoform X2 [Salarias fasciatus]
MYDYSAYFDGVDFFSPCSNTTMKEFSKVFLATLYSVVFILGFIGNGLVVCVSVKYRKQTSLTDICLCNLALSDLVFVLTLPFYARFVVKQQWTFGNFMCHFISGFYQVGFFSSIFFMVVMTLDRYMLIVHAHRAARHHTVKAGIMVVALVWVLSLCISLPSWIFTKVSTNKSGDAWCGDTIDDKVWKHFNLVTTNVLGLILPLLVMIVCYSRIILRLMSLRNLKRHRTVKLIIFIMVIFVVFWAPYNISRFLKFLDLSDDCTWRENVQLSITITEAIAFTHCCLNPIIYAFVGQKFMSRALKMLMSWIPFSSRTSLDSSSRKSSVSRSSDVTSTFVM